MTPLFGAIHIGITGDAFGRSSVNLVMRSDRAARRRRAHTRSRLVGIGIIASLFARDADVLRAVLPQHLLRPLHPVLVVAMHAQQHTAIADASFEPLGLIFGYSHSSQCSDDPAERAYRADAGQQR